MASDDPREIDWAPRHIKALEDRMEKLDLEVENLHQRLDIECEVRERVVRNIEGRLDGLEKTDARKGDRLQKLEAFTARKGDQLIELRDYLNAATNAISRRVSQLEGGKTMLDSEGEYASGDKSRVRHAIRAGEVTGPMVEAANNALKIAGHDPIELYALSTAIAAAINASNFPSNPVLNQVEARVRDYLRNNYPRLIKPLIEGVVDAVWGRTQNVSAGYALGTRRSVDLSDSV